MEWIINTKKKGNMKIGAIIENEMNVGGGFSMSSDLLISFKKVCEKKIMI